MDLEPITAHRPDVILRPDEPYRFTAIDGPEAIPGTRSVLLEGRARIWFGPSLLEASTAVSAALR